MLNKLKLVLAGLLAILAGTGNATFAIFQTSIDLSTYACIRSAASGTCGAATAHYFDAACDGVTIDSIPFKNWVDYGIAQGATQAKLYIPPSSVCVLDTSGYNGCILSDCNAHENVGIKNAIIRSSGGTIKNAGIIGGFGFYLDNQHNTLIQNVLAGASGVVLVTAADASIFSVGDWVAITGLAIQTFGSPGNWHFFEYHRITAITGTTTKTIVLDSPLQYAYKTTWPRMSAGSPEPAPSPDLGGPGMIYKMQAAWDINAEIIGLTFNTSVGVSPIGRNLLFRDVIIPNGIGPTIGVTHSFINSNLGPVEIDKEVVTLNFDRVTAAQVQVQSSSIGTFNITNSHFTTSLNGTAKNTNITNTTIDSGVGNGIRAGATCCGHSNATVLNGVTFNAALTNFHNALLATMSYSSGTFTIAKSSPDYASAISLIVPGFTYYIGDNAGSVQNCTVNKFTVTDVVDAGVNIQIVTNLVGTFPTITCQGFPITPGGDGSLGAYQAETLSVTSSGPANLLSNPEMLPP